MDPGPVAGLRVVGASATKGAGKHVGARARALHGKGFAHDGAAASNELQVGHAATAGRGAVGGSGGGEGPQRGRRGLVQERAHGPRLMKKRLHCR